jgi:hypothetical protein
MRKPPTSPPSRAPEIPGLKIVWLSPWGDVSKANAWRNIIVQDRGRGGVGKNRRDAAGEEFDAARRHGLGGNRRHRVWGGAGGCDPDHGDGANRNDNKYIDNGATFRQVLKGNSIGVEFAGNFPDVTRPASAEQIAAWRILVRVLQSRYGIPNERVYAHNWIDYKDARYCEGCDLATLARSAAFSQKP